MIPIIIKNNPTNLAELKDSLKNNTPIICVPMINNEEAIGKATESSFNFRIYIHIKKPIAYRIKPIKK